MKIKRVLGLVVAGLLVQGLSMAQVGDAKGQKKDPVTDWIQVLVKQMGNKNEVVRGSVEKALVAVGKPAIPALATIPKGKDAVPAARAVAGAAEAVETGASSAIPSKGSG